ncbi:MAG TPA: hypothetical protein VFS52_13735 [Steroidobacteraceae bacterium]|nr:hypothetical protein [Steroidobacteraceae bacterium]
MHTDLRVWLDHFEYHADRRCVLPEGSPDDLTPYERQLIGRSLATFQLAEQIDGPCLMRAARRYEQEQDALPLGQVVALLVAEQNHHAGLLAAFMEQHAIPRRRADWIERAARRVHGLAGFELQIAGLVSAKLIGKVYYRALEAATGCRQLQTLCRILVADELAQVGFESDLLREMNARKTPLARAAHATVHRAFFINAALAVWLGHSRVLRAAGHGARSFVSACMAQYAFYLDAPRLGTHSQNALDIGEDARLPG